jgi:anaerobic selenocysteine-containing dehydrogenase
VATQHCTICPLCEATCGLVVETEAGRVLSIRGDKEDPFSRGYLCPKAAALEDLYEDPDRLRQPVRRSASGWETISWDDAFDEVTRGIEKIQREHGKNAMAFYLGNPSVHNLGVLTTGQLFLRSVRTRSRFSATSADQLPHMLASLLMFGNQLRIPVPDIDRSDYFVIMGGNPLVSNGSLMTAPNMKGRLEEMRKRGGKVVVVDPRRTRTAESADEHLFIRPGSDALLLLAVVHTLFEEDLVSLGRLASMTEGVEHLRSLSRRYAPEAVESATGVAPDEIRQLARSASAARAAVFYGRLGLCAQEFGGLALWLINAINILTGNLDRPGGAMFTTPAFDLPGLARRGGLLGHYDKYRSRVRNLPEFGGELPVSTMADEMLGEGEGQIRALMTIAGNPVLSTPNGKKLDKALEGLEFMVSVDPYINETTRHAHIILPPTTALERDHYDIAFSMFMVRNFAKYAPAVFERGEEQRHDWEIFAELWSRRLGRVGRLGGMKSALSRKLVMKLGPRGLVDLALRFGPHKLRVKKLLENPHGIDLGPLTERLPGVLENRERKILLVPKAYEEDLQRLSASFEEKAGAGSLRLIGRRDLRSNNSWMHNSKRLVKGPTRCTLLVHPEDASRLGLAEGQMASIQSSVGKIEAPVQITEEVMPGVVSLPHGWGHSRSGTRLRVAEAQPGVSLNDLSDDAVLDSMSGNAVLNNIPVEVSPA